MSTSRGPFLFTVHVGELTHAVVLFFLRIAQVQTVNKANRTDRSSGGSVPSAPSCRTT